MKLVLVLVLFLSCALSSVTRADGTHAAGAAPAHEPKPAPTTPARDPDPSFSPAHHHEHRIFRGALKACAQNGSPTNYRELPDRVQLKPMRVLSLLMTEEDGHWRPARPADRVKSCEWVFTNAETELVGKLKPPQGLDDITTVWGPMCGLGRGKYMYVPGLKNPWVFVPSCSIQTSRNFVPIVVVDQGTENGKSRVSQIPIPPDPNWRTKYGFIAEAGIKAAEIAASPSPTWAMAKWALLALRDWQKTNDKKTALEDKVPEPNFPADGKAFLGGE